jgi:hypothetical protein
MDSKQDANMLYALSERLIATISTADNTLYVTDNYYYKYLDKKNDFFFNYKKLDKTAPDTTRIKLSSLPDFKIKNSYSAYNNLTLSFRTFGEPFSKTYKDSSNYRNSVNILKKVLKNGGLIK